MEELAWSNFGATKTNGVIYWAVLNIYYYILIIAKTKNYTTAIPDRNARILGGDGGGRRAMLRSHVAHVAETCRACMHVCMYA